MPATNAGAKKKQVFRSAFPLVEIPDGWNQGVCLVQYSFTPSGRLSGSRTTVIGSSPTHRECAVIGVPGSGLPVAD